jgi:uncharacterized PurR-regulated membrane protein YhhQ (DUF165 family)
MKIVYLRREDYWIYPLSGLGIVFLSLFLYMGSSSLKLMLGVIGITNLYFITYIINKNYTKRHATQFVFVCGVCIVVLSVLAYLLTK